MKPITQVRFRDFAKLAKQKGWTVDDLVDLNGGAIEDARAFFERVLSCRVKTSRGRFDDLSDVVIPYRSVLKLYVQSVRPPPDPA